MSRGSDERGSGVVPELARIGRRFSSRWLLECRRKVPKMLIGGPSLKLQLEKNWLEIRQSGQGADLPDSKPGIRVFAHDSPLFWKKSRAMPWRGHRSSATGSPGVMPAANPPWVP